MTTLAWIFARGSSQGLPGKNLATIGGRTLLGRAIDAATASGVVDGVFVSTDDDAIAEAARAAGAIVPFRRPVELATASISEIEAWRHAITWCRDHDRPIDVIVSCPAIAPLRRTDDIARTVARRAETGADMAVTVTEFEPNPRFTAVDLTDGRVEFVFPRQHARRQDVAATFRIVPVCYAARADYVLGAADLFEGEVVGVPVPAERAVDIDSATDLAFAELLARGGA